MYVKAKRVAFGGLLLALTVLCMFLGTVIETNTLFLLAAASYFVGIVWREFSGPAGAAFYLAGVMLGFLLAPNKLYVATYAAMGGYILAVEAAWRLLEKFHTKISRRALFWVIKYLIFNLLYIPAVFLLQELFFRQRMRGWILLLILAVGQIGLFLYDSAYEYVQRKIWNQLRGRLMQ